MSPDRGRTVRAYSLTVLLCALAGVFAWILDAPSSCFLLAVVAASLMGGRGLAYMAIVLSSCAFEFIFLPPPFHIVHNGSSLLRMAIFVGALLVTEALLNAKRRSDFARLAIGEEFRSLAATSPDGIFIADETSRSHPGGWHMQRNQVTGHSSPWSCGTQVARGLASAALLTLLIHGVAATAQMQSRTQSFSGHTLGAPLPGMPEAASPLTLRAVNDPVTGVASFSFAGNEVPPVLHTSPGHVLQVDYVNAMSTHSTETCVDGPCSNMTNLHFHGLHVSPASPQDDVISMMADPGQSLHYEVQIPADQPPGLYWYHTHPHGESYQQALDGMSGALIVDGIERYAPEVRSMRQQVLVLRDAVLKKGDRASTDEVSRVEASNDGCGSEPEAFGRLLTVNGALRPAIAIQPGEKQFWRVVNASPDLYVDLQLSGETMKIIALDGMPLAFHHPGRRAEIRAHVLLVPGGRVEAIVKGPQRGAHATLRSRCVSTGPDGDPNPAMVLADVTDAPESGNASPLVAAPGRPVYRPIASSRLAALERSTSEFAVMFTEDRHGFYINGRKYAPDDKPMVTVAVGDYHHWSVVNRTREVHPFHIHQVHFLAYAQNGAPLQPAEWLDTVNVAPGGRVDMVMDFTDPIIRGLSVFHCHLLQHEDKGMMAKILFVDPLPRK